MHDIKQADPVTNDHFSGRQSEKRMRLAAKAAQLGIYDWHIPSDTAIWENDRMYAIFGRQPADGPINSDDLVRNYLHGEDIDRFRQSLDHAIATHAPFHFICRISRQNDGSLRWIEYNGEFEYENSTAVRMTGVVQDITERRQLELDRDRFLELGSDLQVITGTNGYFQWVSPAFERLLGWTAAEMTNSPWTSFVHPDDKNTSEEETIDLFTGKWSHAFQNRYRHKDGHYLWLQWHARTYSKENVVYGVARDVTAPKLAEQDQFFLMEITDLLAHLSDPQEMMRQVGERLSMHLGVPRCVFVEYDLAAGTAAIVHEECSADLQSIVGTYRLESMIDPETMEALHRGQQLIINDLRTDPVTADRYGLFAPMHILASLTTPYVSDGKCKCGISIHHRSPHQWEQREIRLMKDVSERAWSSIERARIGLRLHQSRDRLRLLTDAIPVLISYLNKDHYYRFVNKVYTDWFRVDRDDIIGKHLKEIVGDAVYEASLPKIQRVLSGESFKYEQLHPYKFGGTRYVEVSYVPDVSEDGTVNGWYALVQDITDRKMHEEAMKEADRRKDEFLATLSHELRNPMAPLRSALEILEMDVTKVEAGHARAIMLRQVDRMTHLIDDLMDISRISRNKIDLNKKLLDLKASIIEAVEATAPLIRSENHTISVELPEEPLLVQADEDRMVQVLTNLLSNAAKYTDPGGTISIKLSLEDDQAVLRVKDNGIGLAEEDIDTIFEMFNQVSAKSGRGHGGLGIGLNLVKNLVNMHNGTITAQSEGLGKGSEFTMTLPLAGRS